MNTINLTVDFCTRCGYLQPALSLTKELFSHFGTKATIALYPNQEGLYTLRFKDHILSSNQTDEGFLGTEQVIQLIEQLLESDIEIEPEWELEALKGLDSIPSFVRKKVLDRITAMAKQQGISRITRDIFKSFRLKMMENMGGSKALSGGRLAPELQTLSLSSEAKDVLIKYPEFMQKEMLPALQSESNTETPIERDTVNKVATETLERLQKQFASFKDKLPVGTEAPEFTLPDLEEQFHSLSETRGSWTVLEFGAYT